MFLGRNVLTACLLFIAAFLISAIENVQSSDSQPVQSLPSLFPHDSKPFNVTMGVWLERYWNWVGSIDQNLLPRNDKNGENCGINQNGPVWFLDFHIPEGGAINSTKNCEIPEGKAIFIPSHVGEVDQSERPNGPLYTDKEITDSVIDGNNDGHVSLEIDGVEFFDGHPTKNSIEEYSLYRTITDFFNLTYVEDNIWGKEVPKGTYRAQADGYFSIVKPLSAGNHTIELHSDTTKPNVPLTDEPNPDNYIVDQTWHIKIISANSSR